MAALVGITANAGAPGAATPDDGQRQFSKAETLLWQTDHLANIRRPSRLRYRYTKTGTAEEQHTDVIDLEVVRVHPDGQKGVQVHYFTGKQEKPVPEQDPVTGNPVLAVYLQAAVYAMNRHTQGGWQLLPAGHQDGARGDQYGRARQPGFSWPEGPGEPGHYHPLSRRCQAPPAQGLCPDDLCLHLRRGGPGPAL